MRFAPWVAAALLVVLAGCAVLTVQPTVAPPTAIPTPVATATVAPSFTPLPTSTPTPTPAAPVPTPTRTPTFTASPTPTPPPPMPTPTPTAVPPSPTVAASPTSQVTATPQPFFEDLSYPIGAVTSYYNAINRLEYRRAYSYWLNPPQPYDAFAAGFADTSAVQLVAGPPAVPPSDVGPVGVPVLLFAWHTDGSEALYYGCFYVTEIQLEGEMSRWLLDRATLRSTSRPDVTLLEDACPGLESVLTLPRWEVLDQPVNVVFSYYNAILNQDYRRAYGYWEFPKQPYETFAAGFGDTASAFVVVIPPVFIEGAMGSQYAGVPTFLVATQKDGSRPTFVGCFVTRRPNPDMVGEEQPWRIYDASLRPMPGAETDAHALLDPSLCP